MKKSIYAAMAAAFALVAAPPAFAEDQNPAAPPATADNIEPSFDVKLDETGAREVDGFTCTFTQSNKNSKIEEVTVFANPVSVLGIDLSRGDVIYDFGDIAEILHVNGTFYGGIEKAKEADKPKLLLTYGPHLRWATLKAQGLRDTCDGLEYERRESRRPKVVLPAFLSVPQPGRG